jgi:hypothetical protein
MDKVEISLTREDVENHLSQPLTDTEWQALSEELLDSLDYFAYGEVSRLFANIDEYIEDRA